MLFSIITPVYNTEKYLDDYFKSILMQECKDYEVICIDDGSNDKSGDILNAYAKKNNNIKIIKQENSGPGTARNKGIRNAVGEYILFVDSDDMLTNNALNILASKCSLSEANIYTFNIDEVFNDKGTDEQYKEYTRTKQKYNGIYNGKELFAEKIKNNDPVDYGCVLLIKKSWLMKNDINFLDGALYEDAMFSIDCYMNCENIIHINEGLYRYRRREKSITSIENDFTHLKWRIVQLNKCLQYFLEQNLTDQEKSAMSKYIKKTISDIKSIYFKLSKNERAKINQLNIINDLLAYMLDLNEKKIYNNELVMQGFDVTIARYNKIILYGAGKIGVKVYSYIKYKKLLEKVIGYGVSLYEPERFINDIPVRCIKEYCPSEDTLVIISVMENYHNDMYNNAVDVGFTNIIVIDFAIESEIDKLLLSSAK